MRRQISILIIVVLHFSAAPSIADDATEAKIRFDRGVVLLRRNRVEEALGEFFISQRLSPNPSTMYNIGIALEHLGRNDESFTAFSEYLSAHTLTDSERAEGEEALRRIKRKVARLRVASTPAGASIFVDRENLGQHGVTPRAIALRPGRHTVILRLKDHDPIEAEVETSIGSETLLELTLVRLRGKLEVRSKPQGAQITVDGRRTGTTPMDLELPVGEHTIDLEHAGHLRSSDRTTIIAGEVRRYTQELAPIPPRRERVRILTNVADAIVRIDGLEVGFTPSVLELPLGHYKITVEKTGYRPWSQSLDVEEGRPIGVEVELESSRVERDPWPWVFLATGLTAAAVAGGVGIVAVKSAGDYRDAPTDADYDRVGRLNLIADIALLAAILSGATSAGLFLFSPSAAHLESNGTTTSLEVRE